MGEVDLKAIESKLKIYKDIYKNLKLYKFRLETLEPDFLTGSPKNIRGQKSQFSIEADLKTISRKYHSRKNKYTKRYDDLQTAIDELVDMLAAAPLDDEETQYVLFRYVKGKKVKDICKECHYSEKTAYRIKIRALNKLQFLQQKYEKSPKNSKKQSFKC